MDSSAAWQNELRDPTEAFFSAFADRIREPEGLRGALREAVRILTPLVDWEGHLPQMPHGLLGLRAVLRLRSYLAEPSFLRLLATQLHSFAHEPRAASARALQAIGEGSGHWANLELGLREHRPALAWGEALGLAAPRTEDFSRLLSYSADDMANVGHKAVVVNHLGELFAQLEQPKATGRRLLGLAAWMAATEPSDRFWNARVRKRLDGFALRVEPGAPRLSGVWHLEGAREICDLGLVAMLDAFTARMKSGTCGGDLLSILVLAAAEKQLDARRDLEGKTSWNFVYLATLLRGEDPEPWGQAAALVNFFPSDEPEDRIKAEAPRTDAADLAPLLLDAILDAEPAGAMGLVPPLRGRLGAERVLEVLAEAASHNDSGQCHSYQALALAAGADLLPHLSEAAAEALLVALAKSLANSQGSGDLGRLAERALKA